MFKRSLLLVSVILYSSFGYSNSDVKSIELNKDQISRSRVIITGRSSIIIESKNNNTNIIVGKIETLSGGKLLRTIVRDDDMDNYKLSDENSNKKINANISAGLPSEFTIEKAYPNPFNPTTRIRYGVSTTSSVNVAIYDMTGRLVSYYKIVEQAPGWHEFTWQGNDSHGQQVSTGMYLVTMRAGDSFQKQKVTFLK